MELQEFVEAQSQALFEDIKAKLGDKWDDIKDAHEDDVKAVAKYLAEYTFKSKMGKQVDPHLAVLEAIVADFVAIGSIHAQTVIDAVVETVKDYAKEFAKVLFEAGAKAGLEALKDLRND